MVSHEVNVSKVVFWVSSCNYPTPQYLIIPMFWYAHISTSRVEIELFAEITMCLSLPFVGVALTATRCYRGQVEVKLRLQQLCLPATTRGRNCRTVIAGIWIHFYFFFLLPFLSDIDAQVIKIG